MEKLVALTKRRGFVYQGSEIYGGLAGTFDLGPYGVELANNIKNLWWRMNVLERDDMYGIDAAILMNPKAWEASGHVSGFSDPMVECEKCKRRFRADQLDGPPAGGCPECGGKLAEAGQFNMMFKTSIGASGDSSSVTYLRPETAGGMFVNFKNIIDSFHPKLPFGLAQIGKAFRNEIAPRDFLFRVREFEQMEVEYFVKPDSWKEHFEHWRKQMHEWMKVVGIDTSKVHELEVPDGERAHYSLRTIDFEFDWPFGRKELYGLAYRTDYDLRNHEDFSSVDLKFTDEGTGERFHPHVIEPSFGVDRTILAVLLSAYTDDEMGGEPRTYLKLSPRIAPVLAAVFPLLKNKPVLVAKAREVYARLKKESASWRTGGIEFDDNGNIGKRYRRQDEIGTPYCVTIDFDTLENDTVTVRDRDSGQQQRVAVGNLTNKIKSSII